MNILKKHILRPIPKLCRYVCTNEKYVNVSFNNNIKVITLNHSASRNSLSIAMTKNLIDHISSNKNDPNLRAIIIANTGPIFSAGHNLKELSSNVSREQHEEVFSLGTKLMIEIIDCPVPIIARVDGLAAAAGCQLVAQCDIVLCSERSTFSTPGINFGIFCSTPGIALSRKIHKSMMMQMLFTGQPITSQEAYQVGLVNKVCKSEILDDEIDKICKQIKEKSRSVIELGKKFYYKQIAVPDVKNAYVLGAKIMVENTNMKDGKEGIQSFIEKRKPKWN